MIPTLTFSTLLGAATVLGLVCASSPAFAQVTSHLFVPNSEINVVPNSPADTVSIVDIQTGSSLALPLVEDTPIDVAVTPDGRRAYVTNNHSDSVSVIDLETLTVAATIPVGSRPRDLAISLDGRWIYVTESFSGHLTVIDGKNHTVSATLPIGSFLRGIAITPDGTKACIVSNGDSTVTIVDLATLTLVAVLPVDPSPMSVAIAPSGHAAYVTSPFMGTVTPIDLLTRTVGLPFPAGGAPYGIAVTRDGRWALAANQATHTVSVINPASRTVVRTIGVGRNPTGVTIAPDGSQAFVTNLSSDDVSIIDLVSMSVIGLVHVGQAPFHPAMSPPMIVPAAVPLAIASDSDLATRGFGTYVPFRGGTLRLTANWSSSRHLSMLTDGTLDTNGFQADLSGAVVNNGTLTKEGQGTVTLTGRARHPLTRVSRGTLRVDGIHEGRVKLAALGVLAGSGAVGAIDANAGAISPGRTLSPATLRANDVFMGPGAQLQIEIMGTAAYDRLDVSGTADIGGATLNVQPIFSAPPSGSTFIILTNVVGTFAGLPEGAVITTSLGSFRITYSGGDGNDVVLTTQP
jgi:YVTN family beta-propeller protein